MFLKLFVLFTLACATYSRVNENPTSIKAFHALLQEHGYKELGSSSCNANECPAEYDICCAQEGMMVYGDIGWYCCPSSHPTCFKDNGIWKCRAEGSRLGVNFGFIAILSILIIGKERTNIFQNLM